MNKKLLTIAIVLVILIAGIPITSAEPGGLTKAWEAINALQVLVANMQTQIAQLTTKTNNIPIIISGREASNGDEIYPPAGYTKDDCDIILQPMQNIPLKVISGDLTYNAVDMSIRVEPFGHDYWTIDSLVVYEEVGGNPPLYWSPDLYYTIICPVTKLYN